MRLDENSFTTSRIGVRRSYRVHGPDARPKLVVKAPPQADGTGTQVHIANGPFRTSDFGFPSGFGFRASDFTYGCRRNSAMRQTLGSPFLLRDPPANVLLDDVQRHGAALENDVVKLAQVELDAQLPGRTGAKFLDLEFANLVGERLAGPGNVTVDFVDYVQLRFRRVRQEKVDGLLPVPVQRVDARIHHEPHRAPHFISELAEFGVGIVVKAHVLTEA